MSASRPPSRRRTVILTAVLTFDAVLAVLALGLWWVAASGTVNVAATERESAPVRWFLETTSDSSIEKRAAALEAPEVNPAMADEAVEHYQEMCVTCHGAPGVDRSETGQGLNPRPPLLSRRKHERKETFWVVKNGIRMTGMPAYGPTHDDEILWAIADLVEQLPDIDADTWAQKVKSVGAEMEGEHEEGEHEMREYDDEDAEDAAPTHEHGVSENGAPDHGGHEHGGAGTR